MSSLEQKTKKDCGCAKRKEAIKKIIERILRMTSKKSENK